jgi:hypothetical protein
VSASSHTTANEPVIIAPLIQLWFSWGR